MWWKTGWLIVCGVLLAATGFLAGAFWRPAAGASQIRGGVAVCNACGNAAPLRVLDNRFEIPSGWYAEIHTMRLACSDKCVELVATEGYYFNANGTLIVP